MARYFLDLVGVDIDEVGYEFCSALEARNAAIVHLGEYLKDCPEYAYQGHWQVDLYDEKRELILNVVVATVNTNGLKRLP